MPRARMSKAQVQKVRIQCQAKFDRALDSCLEDGIFTPNQCLEDAARQWVRCMEGSGITIRATAVGGEKPQPKLPAEPASRRKKAR